MDSISEAIKAARYGDAVVVAVSPDEPPNETKEIVLVATLDEEHGGIVWKDVTATLAPNSNCGQGETGDEDVGIVRHVRTKRWLLPMLNDTKRNELYDAAIEASCRDAVTRLDKRMDPLHVLDIGSGTGLLAMMAAKHSLAALKEREAAGKDDVDPSLYFKVTSLEMASAMARLARMTIASNKLETNIEVIEGHSCETVLEKKAQICISELLESGLLGEGLLPALRDAWNRHLHPDAVVVPKKARVFAQVLEGKDCIGRYRGPNHAANSPIRLRTSMNDDDVLLGYNGEASPREGILVPVHAEALFCSSPLDGEYSAARALSEPTVVLEFDFSKELIPGPEGRCCTTSIIPTASGTAHGILFWWELDLWDDITYSTKYGTESWQDHWQQCLFIFPEALEQCPTLCEGNECKLICSHTDLRISFAIHFDDTYESHEPPKKRLRHVPSPAEDSGTTKQHISPERALQLNDEQRSALLQQAISTALATKGKSVPILDVSDFSLCAMMAAVQGATHVSSLESSTGSIPMLSAQVAQLGNGLPRTDETGHTVFQILQSHAENLTLDIFLGKPVQVVMAEPYFESLEGWHLQEALNYYYTVRSLKQRRVISSNAISVPSYAAVMGCAVQFDSFAKAYKRCGDTNGSSRVRGFCHDVVNQLGCRYHQQDTSLPLWQYHYKRMTDSFELARISYEGSCPIENNGVWKSVPFRMSGICHGLVSWIEYGLRIATDDSSSGDCDFRVMTTASRSHQQLMRMLPAPVTLSEDNICNALFFCKTSLGGLNGLEDHSFDLQIQM